MKGFENLIKSLCANDVDFVIIGGFAAVVHGVSTLTQDIDLAVSFDENNFAHLVDALQELHPVHRQNNAPLDENSITAGFKNLYLLTDVGPVDCLSEVAGIGAFDEVLKQSIEIDLFDHKCRVLSIDGLIETKKQMNRPKDKETIIQLMAIKEKLQDSN